MDPLLFVSTKYYAFKRDLAEYFISSWKNGTTIESNIILDLDSTFFPQKEGLLIETWQKACLKKVARFKNGFTVRRIVNQGNRLFSTKQPDCILLYIEEWSSIV